MNVLIVFKDETRLPMVLSGHDLEWNSYCLSGERYYSFDITGGSLRNNMVTVPEDEIKFVHTFEDDELETFRLILFNGPGYTKNICHT